MTKWKIAGIAAGVCILPVAGAFFSLGRCVPLTDGAKAKLLAYVGKKYKIPADAGLQFPMTHIEDAGALRPFEEWNRKADRKEY